MRQKLLLLLLSFSSCFFANGQDVKEAAGIRAQSIFGELGGNGIFLSLNYDTRFSRKNNGLGGRAGIGLVPGFSFGFGGVSTIVTFPIGLNYLIGKGPNYLEAGAGATFSSGSVNFIGEESKFSSVIFVPSIGYRYQPLRKGFTGRVVVSPLIGSGGAGFYAGISGGISL